MSGAGIPDDEVGAAGIVPFLEARIAEDEADLQRWAGISGAPEWAQADYNFGGTDDYQQVTMGYGRALAECKAKRRIVDLYEYHRSNRDARRSPRARAAEDEKAAQERRTQEGRTRAAEEAMLALASVYADHPDYQQGWANDV